MSYARPYTTEDELQSHVGKQKDVIKKLETELRQVNRTLEEQRYDAKRASAEAAEAAGAYLSPFFSLRFFEALCGIQVISVVAGVSGAQLHEYIASPKCFSAGTSGF